MMSVVASPALQLTLAQLRGWLHVQPGAELYAMLCSGQYDGLQAQLDQLRADRNDPLWPGMLSAEAAAQVPVLCRIPADSAVESWLLNLLLGVKPGLGVLGTSRAGYAHVRSHCRAQCTAHLPDGAQVRLDWMDPAILGALLTHLEDGQQTDLFGPFDQLLVAAAGGLTAWHLEPTRRVTLQPIELLAGVA